MSKINIVRCIYEKDINKIVEENKERIVLIYFCYTDEKIMSISTNNKNKKILKHKIGTQDEYTVIYVDLKQYFYKEGRYSMSIQPKMLPCIRYIYNERIIGELIGADEKSIEENTTKLKEMIDDIKNREVEEKNNEEINKKKDEEQKKKQLLKEKEKMKKIEELKNEHIIMELERIRDEKIYEQNKKNKKTEDDSENSD